MSDEQRIRDLVQTWMDATGAGDVETMLGLMTDDVAFLVPGQEPFGSEAFRRAAEAADPSAPGARHESSGTVEEVEVSGDWAFARTRLLVTTISAEGDVSSRRSGYTLSIFRRDADGRWRLARDANLLTEES